MVDGSANTDEELLYGTTGRVSPMIVNGYINALTI
jgi:hypothetical protein